MTALLSACGGGQPEQDTLVTANAGDSLPQGERMTKTRKIFYNIPSPMEMAALLKKAGASYNSKILNDVKNVDKYTAASKQALNLGVYGADLSYASVFNHTQESMFYTSCAKRLADRLGVNNAFNDSTLEAMEKNQNDRDKLLDIISETFWSVDAYLKENGRDNISALMVAGGWMEGLYIATQVSSTSDSPELRQRIAEQKLSLKDLMALLDTYQTDDAALAGVREDLKAIAALYTDVTVGDGGTAALTDAQLAAIRSKAATIRNTYIN
ncbi:MAG: hypothetical protein IPI81_09340 [Flavobacteriales bacterium]|nr:hypothetical protein [Flavobacteriales bacterium]MCC6937507.1 hypothetical protein [Flavobacteriales bacterium]